MVESTKSESKSKSESTKSGSSPLSDSSITSLKVRQASGMPGLAGARIYCAFILHFFAYLLLLLIYCRRRPCLFTIDCCKKLDENYTYGDDILFRTIRIIDEKHYNLKLSPM